MLITTCSIIDVWTIVLQTGLSTFTAEDVPLTTHRKLDHMLNHAHSKEAWLETMCCPENKKLGIIDLHPDVFATFPRYCKFANYSC
jgi:hypothetical protein